MAEGKKVWNGGGALSYGGRAILKYSCGVPPPEFLVTPLLMGPVCLYRQDRFEEPVRPSTLCKKTVKEC